MQYKDLYNYIGQESTSFKVTKIPITDGWEWNFFDHVRKSTLYKNSKFDRGVDDGNRPFRNIIRPILNVAYRSEGFDVKDIEPFVDDEENYYKSFLVRKFHTKWARENDLDTFIDEVVESYVDYGGVIVKNVNDVRPEVVPLQRIAFCDQTDILSGPICEIHQYSIDQLLEMKGKWYDDKIDMAVMYAESQKDVKQANDQKAKTPGKYIEVYELHGMFTDNLITDGIEGEGEYKDEESKKDKYTSQIHVIACLRDEDNNENYICLFRGREKEPIYKVLLRDKIFGRALGFGGIEELFEPQIWTNYSEIKIKAILDMAALNITLTDDEGFATRNKNIEETENGEVLTHKEGTTVSPYMVQPVNITAFNNAVARWEVLAKTTGSANDALLGVSPASGTPFKLQELVTNENKDLHAYRQGKIASFLAEIYRDWILEYLVNQMNKGQKFLDELSLDELQAISGDVIQNETNTLVKKAFLDGKTPTQQSIDGFKEVARGEFMKNKKQFLEILQNEFKSIPVDVKVNIAGKQKNLLGMVDKLVNIFRQIIAAPQILQQPGFAKTFNEIIEYSGLSPVDFTSFTKPGAPIPSPLGQEVLATANNQ